jgi:hypothetical protein
MKNQIELIYDYIVNVTVKQGKLLDVDLLYGDGSRFNNNRDLFNIVYNQIALILPNNLKK